MLRRSSLRFHLAAEGVTASKLGLRMSVLRQYQEQRDEVAETVAAKNRSGKLNKSQQKLIDNGQAMQNLAETLTKEFLDDFNQIKGEVDDAYRARDWEAMEKAVNKVRALRRRTFTDWDRAFGVVAKNRKIYRADSALRAELVNIRDFVKMTVNEGWKISQKLKNKDPAVRAKAKADKKKRQDEAAKRKEQMDALRAGRWEEVESEDLKEGDIVLWPHNLTSIYELGEIEPPEEDHRDPIGHFYKFMPEKSKRPLANRLWSGMKWQRKKR